MNIGEVATASGVSAKMIRYYESAKVLPSPRRSRAGYRQYSDKDVNILKLVRHAKAVGFQKREVKRLISLWLDEQRASRDVHHLAREHLNEIKKRIDELRVIAATLDHLIQHCHGDDRPNCPILDGLSGT